MANFNQLDFFVAFVVVMGAFYGVYKGFIFSALGFAGKILSAMLTIKFLDDFINIFKVKETFLKGTVAIIKDYIPLSEEIKNISLRNGNIDFNAPYLQGNMFVKVLGENISREIERLYDMGHGLLIDTVGDMMSLILANYIVNILSFIVLFLIFLLGFSLLRRVLVKLVGLSIFTNGLDKILGFIFGAAVNIFILALFLGISFDILNLVALKDGGMLSSYKELMNSSYLKDYLYYTYSLIISEGIKLL